MAPPFFFFYASSYDAHIPSCPLSFGAALFVALDDKGGNKGMEDENEMRPFDTKATRCVDSHHNELLAPFRTIPSLPRRLLQRGVICGRAKKAGVEFRGFHANQFYAIIRVRRVQGVLPRVRARSPTNARRSLRCHEKVRKYRVAHVCVVLSVRALLVYAGHGGRFFPRKIWQETRDSFVGHNAINSAQLHSAAPGTRARRSR